MAAQDPVQPWSPAELAVFPAAVEAGPDGVVVVSADSRMLAFNERFAAMWPIPADVVRSRSDEAALQSVLDKLVDPVGFLARVRELYVRASGTAYDELHLLDGRIFDRHGSALHDADGDYLGWAWYFRDVTAERAAAADAARMSALVAIAQALSAAESEADVLDVVTGPGARALAAQGAVLCLTEPGQPYVRVLTAGPFSDELRAEIAVLPPDTELPMVATATGGPALFLADRTEAVARFPAAGGLYDPAGTQASAAVPLASGDQLLGSLSIAWGQARTWRDEDRSLVEALSSLTAQALGRIRAQRAEQAAALAVRRMAETLQRSLLSAPPASLGFEVAVRYQAAAQEAQVGGDWHDAFERRDGVLTLVVGDVAGHDRAAAAAMAQCRNVLRGVAQTLPSSPAAVLMAFDDALAALHVDVIATAVLCQVRRRAHGGAELLTWSNAGHPPPVLLLPDGSCRLLDTDPDLLLGMEPSSARADAVLDLPRGSLLVLYTDGLVERRQQDLDDALSALVESVRGLTDVHPELVCDVLLEELGGTAEDDVAVLALRVS